MNIRDIREIMGLTQSQVAEELGVPKQEVVDCEENGETYLLLQYISAFPINPQVLADPDADPFLPSFDQTTPGNRMRLWREENGIPPEEMASAIGMAPDELLLFEAGEGNQLNRRRGEEIEKKTGMNRKWLMYGDGREKGSPRLAPVSSSAEKAEGRAAVRGPAPNKAAGSRIRDARRAAGMGREELADLLELSVSRVTQIESGYVKDAAAERILRKISVQSGMPLKESPKAAGARLREFRKASGLSVKEAAEILGLKTTTLAHLESGYVTGAHADELIEKLRSAPRKAGSGGFDPKKAGQRIRTERIRAGLSQKELGTILRLPANVISQIELGNVTEELADRVLSRIHGKPSREVVSVRVRPKSQVILGSNIRDARIAAGLSQKALGSMLNLPQTKISYIEHGRIDGATGSKILQMLRALPENRAEDSSDSPDGVSGPESGGRRAHRPDLGEKIREARLEAGLSQKDLAALLNLSQGRISYIEQGKIDTETAEKIIRLIREHPSSR